MNDNVADELPVDSDIEQSHDSAASWLEEGLALAKQEAFEAAITAFSRGLGCDPFNERLYRHRGHRYITVGRFSEALADLEMATRLDPGKRDSWYHLGLACYLLGLLSKAETSWRQALDLSVSWQERVSTADWYWMTLMRLGKRDQARELLDSIPETIDPGENSSYFERIMLYKGQRTVDEIMAFEGSQPFEIELANQGYGLANFLYLNGAVEQGNALLLRIVTECPKHWAFGYLAAQLDLRSRGLLP